jgi:hypothetical protein
LNYEERLALALTMIELGDELVDFGMTATLLIKRNFENKNLFNQAMAKHLEGTGFAVREVKQVYGEHKKSKTFHKLLQQQLQLSTRVKDAATNKSSHMGM